MNASKASAACARKRYRHSFAALPGLGVLRERKGTIASWTSVAQQGKPAGMISS
jgi:hypothetical protein